MKTVGMRNFCVTSLAAEMLSRFIRLLFAKEYLTLDRMYIRHSLLWLSKGAHFLSECNTF
jgi:hypothetical protein